MSHNDSAPSHSGKTILLLAFSCAYYGLFEWHGHPMASLHTLNSIVCVWMIYIKLKAGSVFPWKHFFNALTISIPLSFLHYYVLTQAMTLLSLQHMINSDVILYIASLSAIIPYALIDLFQYYNEAIQHKIHDFFANQTDTRKDSSFYTLESNVKNDLFIELFEKLKILASYSPVAIFWTQPGHDSLTYIHQDTLTFQTQIETLPVSAKLQATLLSQKQFKTEQHFWLDHTLRPLQEFLSEQCHLFAWDLYVPIEHKGHAQAHFFLKKREPVSSYFPEFHSIQKTSNVIRHAVYTHVFLKQEREIQVLLEELHEKRNYQEDLQDKIDDLNHMVTDINKKQNDLIKKEKLASISNITVTLHHEINNPLTHILGSSQLIQARFKKNITVSENELLHTMRQILVQTIRICNIIRSLRTLSSPKVESYLPDINMIKLNIKNT